MWWEWLPPLRISISKEIICDGWESKDTKKGYKNSLFKSPQASPKCVFGQLTLEERSEMHSVDAWKYCYLIYPVNVDKIGIA